RELTSRLNKRKERVRMATAGVFLFLILFALHSHGSPGRCLCTSTRPGAPATSVSRRLQCVRRFASVGTATFLPGLRGGVDERSASDLSALCQFGRSSREP